LTRRSATAASRSLSSQKSSAIVPCFTGGHVSVAGGNQPESVSEIERELGFALDWEELPEGQDSRISVSLDGADPENEGDWTRQHEWLARRLNEMHRVLAPRIRALDPDSWRPEGHAQ
jgi:hypothetical protein